MTGFKSGLELVFGFGQLESSGQVLQFGFFLGVIHGKPAHGVLGSGHGFEFHVLGDQMVAGHFVDLLSSQQDPVGVLDLVSEDLEVANAAFFPLFGVRIESEHFAAMKEHGLFVLFPCGHFNQGRQGNNWLKVRIVVRVFMSDLIVIILLGR